MLQSLLIENYALIDKLEIRFQDGLNIITGETGAGKSILLGAVGLLLGQRADMAALKDKERSCIVEGTFAVATPDIEQALADSDIDVSDGAVVIRRLISPNGKSRTFVNDQPVTLQALKEIGEKLVDIHSQYQNILLQNAAFQLKVVDSLAGNKALQERYHAAFAQLRQAEQQLAALEEQAQLSKSESDYLGHLFSELEAARLQADELEALESEQQQLAHAEEIKLAFVRAGALLSSDEAGATKALREAKAALDKMAGAFAKAEALATRLQNVLVEVKDIAHDVDAIAESTEVNAARLAEVSERLDLIFALLKKHRVNTLDELLAVREQLRQKVSFIGNLDELLAARRKERDALLANARALADQLSKARSSVFAGVESHVVNMLKSLGIPSPTMQVAHAALPALTPTGQDDIRFLFSANKGVPPQDIARVASGGEISRLMLCLKSLIAWTGNLPTIIFDEIDTGVSGEVADCMGKIIRELGKSIQVVNITHLPQIASKGQTHFLVYKQESGAGTTTNIRRLTEEERVREIAKMLSGQTLTDTAIKNAKELLAVGRKQ
ncbi:MAG: DNA repair protein RecN [Prevotellaceae bacterium]|jgi:DNA repair protein RecN (Recombination protein N)|nr:DNA repair protein RecN [Prevotellaceae bacterium]